jgi:hypothetical protein
MSRRDARPAGLLGKGTCPRPFDQTKRRRIWHKRRSNGRAARGPCMRSQRGSYLLPPPGKPPPPLYGPKAGLWGNSDDGAGVQGESATGNGLVGISGDRSKLQAPHGSKNGVVGRTDSDSDSGVWGDHPGAGYGVAGSSLNGNGVIGLAFGAPGGGGVNNGVIGRTTHGDACGVWGDNPGSGFGVAGTSAGNCGVVGLAGGAQPPSVTQNGVMGRTTSAHDSGVWGDNAGAGIGVGGTSATGIGVYGQGGHLAGRFEGDVEVTGDIRLVNQDCAEDFEMLDAGEIDPGSVVVIDSSGVLKESDQPYDKRVAGVIAGAGGYKPGLILGSQRPQLNKRPVALVGKVACRVDAGYSAVEVGDLLTTSPTPGHAMKASDPLRSFGAVIGKALQAMASGQGLVTILVALQ